jgi:hypothetical protein
MRTFVCAAAVLGLAMVTSPETVRSALAAAASALVEATPFLFASILVSRVLHCRPTIVEQLGCGCGSGPSARSLPAAAATWLLFGPLVAIARYVAASCVALMLRKRHGSCTTTFAVDPNLLGELSRLLPAALLAGGAVHAGAFVDPSRLPPYVTALFGLALGFLAAPCGLGAVALAAALRVREPIAAAAFFCVAGIVDFRAVRHVSHAPPNDDALAYAMLAAALGVVAWRRGDALVHPAFSAAVAGCACAAAFYCLHRRQRRCAAARAAPALMLVGALLGAPPPQYHATETTMADLFAGEHLKFSGSLVRNARTSALVRYAITCCRADASPIAVRLARTPDYPAGTWLRVDGTVALHNGVLLLAPARVERIPAPRDPFVYL